MRLLQQLRYSQLWLDATDEDEDAADVVGDTIDDVDVVVESTVNDDCRLFGVMILMENGFVVCLELNLSHVTYDRKGR